MTRVRGMSAVFVTSVSLIASYLPAFPASPGGEKENLLYC